MYYISNILFTASFWTAEEVDLSRDLGHWHGLKVKGQKMFCNCAGFFGLYSSGPQVQILPED
jgi:ribonucleotide reductase beta subunit family protein with ferritin-like domain